MNLHRQKQDFALEFQQLFSPIDLVEHQTIDPYEQQMAYTGESQQDPLQLPQNLHLSGPSHHSEAVEFQVARMHPQKQEAHPECRQHRYEAIANHREQKVRDHRKFRRRRSRHIGNLDINCWAEWLKAINKPIFFFFFTNTVIGEVCMDLGRRNRREGVWVS
ncbi:Hypothetical predicted protein [Prunus dulcis]|uniref:Uncharacterized protein n=1 Tax=Prunus dulcis TaxID=3755 RepID=A0A5E4F2M2_PRUDU|nr:hypothetical protein L3X38_043000 [Prunus dulcis]VVA21972.1 Hypothetical predicted protein [Prunus dulcis]